MTNRARRYRIDVDRDTCAGSGICAGLAPEYFEMDEGHVARPVREVTDAAVAVEEAAANCPVDAIVVFDADTGEPLG